jgi:hypothetical protein
LALRQHLHDAAAGRIGESGETVHPTVMNVHLIKSILKERYAGNRLT